MGLARKIRLLAAMVATLVLCITLPLAGAVLMGAPVTQFLEFPPRTRYVDHPPFRWDAFIGLAVAELLLLWIPLVWALRKYRECTPRTTVAKLPWWGWIGLAFGIISWTIAWTRFPFAAPIQRHTFTPLWISYILTVNAFCFRLTGRCMLTHSTRFFLTLFPVSAIFWWLFEFLNRFVQNWYYVGIGELSGLEYFWFATLPFSTVLPAVLGTYELLQSILGSAPLVSTAHLTRRQSKLAASVILFISLLGLLGIGRYPNMLFPLLWVAPLLTLAGLMELFGEDSIFFHVTSPVEIRRVALLALAALICGFFWEMWNFFSFAKWIYAVPYVQRFHIFEMPILGYAGYLPFGLECGLTGIVVRLLLDKESCSLFS